MKNEEILAAEQRAVREKYGKEYGLHPHVIKALQRLGILNCELIDLDFISETDQNILDAVSKLWLTDEFICAGLATYSSKERMLFCGKDPGEGWEKEAGKLYCFAYIDIFHDSGCKADVQSVTHQTKARIKENYVGLTPERLQKLDKIRRAAREKACREVQKTDQEFKG